FSFTAERFFSTAYWSWYEKQGLSTFLVFACISTACELISFELAHMTTFGQQENQEKKKILIIFKIIIIINI
ncbi:hypothetical protein PFISCL1PPCAC_13315, partial [Pristionchus fissidentatus]